MASSSNVLTYARLKHSCKFPGCNNKLYKYNPDPKYTNKHFFHIPQDVVIRSIWCSQCNIPIESLPKICFLCEDHFSQSDIIVQSCRSILKSNSIPSASNSSKTSNHKNKGTLQKLDSSNEVENNDPSERLDSSNSGTSLFSQHSVLNGRACAIVNCYSPIKPLHRFPNPRKCCETFKTWIQLTGNKIFETIDDLRIYKSYRVCDKHFTQEDIESNNCLKKDSVPTKFLPCQNERDQEKNEKPVIFWVEPRNQTDVSHSNEKSVSKPIIAKEMPQNLETNESMKKCKLFTDGLIPRLLELDEGIRLQVMAKINDVISDAQSVVNV